MFAMSIGILAALLQSGGQPLSADSGRDRMLHAAILEFFEGAATSEQLSTAVLDFAQQFEARPYKIGRLAIDLSTVPEDRIKRWTELVSGIIGPPLQAFINGTMTPAQVAVKVAPFVLVFGGPYGFDPSTNRTPDWAQRSEELTKKISEFAAP